MVDAPAMSAREDPAEASATLPGRPTFDITRPNIARVYSLNFSELPELSCY